MDREFLFLLSSARRDGNTETLARRAAESLSADVRQRWLRLLELRLPPFEDVRHGDGEYKEPSGDLGVLCDATLSATDIVFVAPVYWYSLPAPAKLYLDHWSAWMRVPALRFTERMAGKTLWVVTVVSDQDRGVSRPLIDTLRMTADYMKMRWGGAIVGFGNRVGEIEDDRSALAEAARFFGGAP